MKSNTMTIEEMRTLSPDKLYEIAARKNYKGNGTVEAYKAQRVLQERSGHWRGVSRKPCTFAGQLIKERGDNGFVKKFK